MHSSPSAYVYPFTDYAPNSKSNICSNDRTFEERLQNQGFLSVTPRSLHRCQIESRLSFVVLLAKRQTLESHNSIDNVGTYYLSTTVWEVVWKKYLPPTMKM